MRPSGDMLVRVDVVSKSVGLPGAVSSAACGSCTCEGACRRAAVDCSCVLSQAAFSVVIMTSLKAEESIDICSLAGLLWCGLWEWK